MGIALALLVVVAVVSCGVSLVSAMVEKTGLRMPEDRVYDRRL